MPDINEPTLPAIPEAAIEAAAIVLWNREGGGPDPVPGYIRHDVFAVLAASLPYLAAPAPIQDDVTDKEIEAVRAQLATVTRALTLLARAARSVFGALAPGESLAGDAGHTNHLIHLTNEADALVLSLAAAIPRPRSEAATHEDAEAVAPIPDPARVELVELVERLRNVQRHFSDPGSFHRATVTEAVAALTASNDRVAELEREAAQWQAAAGQLLVRAEALEDRLETVERERDEARDRARILGDKYNQWFERAKALEAELARLQSAQPAGDRPGSGETRVYSDREVLELLRMLLMAQIREERINSFEELRALLRHVNSALAHNPQASNRPTYRHKKRGTEYVLIGYGRMQTASWGRHWPRDNPAFGKGTIETVYLREVAIYRSATDPTEIWVSPREEFEDGRFEVLK